MARNPKRATEAGESMARPKSDRNTTNAKIATEALDNARIASGFTGETLVDFVSRAVNEVADRVIDEEYAKRKARKAAKEKGAPPEPK